MAAKNPGNIIYWKADHNEQIRLAISQEGLHSKILYRKNENEEFKEILSVNINEQFKPICFNYDNKNIFAASNIGRDKIAIIEYDPDKLEQVRIIYKNPEVDVEHLYGSIKRKVLTHVMYYKDKMHYHILDEDMRKLKTEFDTRFPGEQVIIASQSKDETKLLIKTFSDKNPGAYYYYNRSSGEFIKLLDETPWINSGDMAATEPVYYRSRDGLKIHAYLTIPKGMKKTNLPLVVNPHGGPWTRDKWEFNKEVQFLANRGYAVLQMNFRGSSGYGQTFLEAGYKEWGRKMQNDVTDGVKWLIEQGIADSTRIAIYGYSYGGFSAMAGLAFTPNLYTCGISNCGISNIFTFLDSMPDYWQIHKEQLYEMIGSPETEKEMLRKASPVFSVNKIKAPLFIAQGA
ncbi:MAG: S9 family peptidase, partial [Calditrichia bacterium]|nr:S9 family peptidase [Calditrichia bacterium]